MQGALCVLFSCFIVFCASQGPQCNRPNEKVQCVRVCPPEKTCRNRGIFFSCLNDKNTKICQQKCVCTEGYIRNDNGDCIPETECDNPAIREKRSTQQDLFPVKECNGPNEFFQCGPACDNVCVTLHKQNRTNCPIVNIMCNSRCYCNDGYARDDSGVCIPIDKCNKPVLNPNEPEGHCSGPNEIYTCKNTCPPELCFSVVAEFKCDSTEVCKPHCACKPGYLRVHEKSACVPICQCPQMRNSPDCEKKV